MTLNKAQQRFCFPHAPERFCSTCGSLCKPYKATASYDSHTGMAYVTVWHKCPKAILFISYFLDSHREECSVITDVVFDEEK